MPVVIRDCQHNIIATVPYTNDLRKAVQIVVGKGISLAKADLGAACLSGADFYDADFSGADLSGADLSGTDLQRANLRHAVLNGANLRGANLEGADLRNVDLIEADLGGANLGSDEFLSSIRVSSLHRRMLAAIRSGGKLDMDSWHTCDTTHCRAGWAIQLAGPAGAVLEHCLGAAVAGALIHVVSCPSLDGKVPNFFASNEEAMADIKRLAELEPPL